MSVKVLMTVTAAIFWNLMLYTLVNYCQHFRGTICLHLQIRRVSHAVKKWYECRERSNMDWDPE
jgi:hypothetical protein